MSDLFDQDEIVKTGCDKLFLCLRLSALDLFQAPLFYNNPQNKGLLENGVVGQELAL